MRCGATNKALAAAGSGLPSKVPRHVDGVDDEADRVDGEVDIPDGDGDHRGGSF